MKQAVLIFSKNLIQGKVKTRLAATIGNERAMLVYGQLVRHTASITHDLPFEKMVFYSDFIEKQDVWSNQVYKKQVQSGEDLGKRMLHAFTYAFREGNREVAIIGTDCYELTSATLMNAFSRLKAHDVVIGPAGDGGYYLLAMKKIHQQLFQNIQWSTPEVLKQTLAVCSGLKLTVDLLPVLSDIDTEKDLVNIEEELISKVKKE